MEGVTPLISVDLFGRKAISVKTLKERRGENNKEKDLVNRCL